MIYMIYIYIYIIYIYIYYIYIYIYILYIYIYIYYILYIYIYIQYNQQRRSSETKKSQIFTFFTPLFTRKPDFDTPFSRRDTRGAPKSVNFQKFCPLNSMKKSGRSRVGENPILTPKIIEEKGMPQKWAANCRRKSEVFRRTFGILPMP